MTLLVACSENKTMPPGNFDHILDDIVVHLRRKGSLDKVKDKRSDQLGCTDGPREAEKSTQPTVHKQGLDEKNES